MELGHTDVAVHNLRRYKIKVEIVGLCSYHAYNRCDTHGASIKKAAHRQACKGGGPLTSTDFAAMITKMPAADVRGIEVYFV